MSNPDKKQPTKKTNSYSLLLKSLSDGQKPKPPKNSSSSKKSASISTPDSPMSSRNDDRDNPTSENDMHDPDVPDRSYGDYFCKICDSHMNSENMWEAHVTGKRHIKNVKKGDTDSKYEDLPDVESNIKNELKNIKDEPIVGLSYIHEIRRKEPNVPPIYNCFLCHASIATIPLVTEHAISMKHRLNYIKENNPEEYNLIESTNLKKGHMEPLVIEAARNLEQKLGRGTVKVKQEKKKSSVATYSAKKSFNIDDDFDDRFEESHKNSRFDNSTSLWKSVDTGKDFRRRERSRSPRDFEDNFIHHARSKSPREFKERKWMLYEGHSVDNYKKSFSKRNISSREEDYERHRSLSKRDVSPDDYERHRSSSKRAISPRQDDYERHRSFSKRDISPRHDDYHYRSTNSYSYPSGKSDSRDRSSYITPPAYENTSSRESVKTYNGFNAHQKPVSFLPPERSVENLSQQKTFLPQEKSIASFTQRKSAQDVFNDSLLLSSEECYKLFFDRLVTLPEIKTLEELILLTKLIGEAQKKLKNKLAEQVIAVCAGKHNAANIPGLGDAMPSSAEPQGIRNENSYKPSIAVDAESFINSIFKSANLSPVSNKIPASQNLISFNPPSFLNLHPSSYQTPQAAPVNAYQTPLSAPVNTYQTPQAAPVNTYQTPEAAPVNTYQTPRAAPVNTYQAPSSSSYQVPSTSSYQASSAKTYQGPSGSSYTNMPFPPSSVSNYSLNTSKNPGRSFTQEGASEAHIYNYSHHSSASSAPKNYPHKY